MKIRSPLKWVKLGELYIKDAFRDGYFTVGDMTLQDEEGYYYIVDRKKDMLTSGGINIYPSEIEETLYSHPDILDVAVIGIPDPVLGESVKAIVVPREGVTLTEKDIINYCDGKIASYKKPKSVDFVKALPRNPSGKILKLELRSKCWDQNQVQI
jgi:long-chain acyl-CoA synthetase